MLFTSWVNHLEYSEQLQQSGAEMEVSSLLTPQQTSSHNCQLRADTWKNFHGQKCHDTSPELSSTLRNLKNSTWWYRTFWLWCKWWSVHDLWLKCPRPTSRGHFTEHGTRPALLLRIFSAPNRAMLWCSHLLRNLSWFLISQHPALQTGCSPGSPVWFYISTLFITQYFGF